MEKMNSWFIAHPRLTLLLMSVFTTVAVAIGVYLAVFYTDMDYFVFLGYLAVPVLLAVYFRLMYGKYQQAQKNRNDRVSKDSVKKQK